MRKYLLVKYQQSVNFLPIVYIFCEELTTSVYARRSFVYIVEISFNPIIKKAEIPVYFNRRNFREFWPFSRKFVS